MPPHARLNNAIFNCTDENEVGAQIAGRPRAEIDDPMRSCTLQIWPGAASRRVRSYLAGIFRVVTQMRKGYQSGQFYATDQGRQNRNEISMERGSGALCLNIERQLPGFVGYAAKPASWLRVAPSWPQLGLQKGSRAVAVSECLGISKQGLSLPCQSCG